MTSEPGSAPDDLPARLAGLRLFALDVDGTLTDGRIVYDSEGRELQAFDVHDGYGLARLRQAGVEIVWITGRGSEATARRARELGVAELRMQAGPKAEVLAELQERFGVDRDQTAAMGDDLPDLGLRERASFFAAPANARADVRAAADYVAQAAGGAGAVREVCDVILSAKGHGPRPSARG